jgi:hypothetical protein
VPSSSSTAAATHGLSGPAIDCPPPLSDSFRLAQPHRQGRHLFPDYFIYSGKQAASTSSAPSFFCACDHRGGLLCWSLRKWCVWLCPLPCTSGIGNIGACLHPRLVLGCGKPGAHIATAALISSSASIFLPDDCLDASPSSSTMLSLMRH